MILAAMSLSACGFSNGSDAPTDLREATLTYQVLDAFAGGTVQAIQSQEAQATLQASLPSPTFTPGPPTPTPTPTNTSTPVVPIIEVSIDTNCRSGPGKEYDMVGALLVGETTEILAASSVPNYWIVDNPVYPGHECWLWARFATVSGDTSQLPVR